MRPSSTSIHAESRLANRNRPAARRRLEVVDVVGRRFVVVHRTDLDGSFVMPVTASDGIHDYRGHGRFDAHVQPPFTSGRRTVATARNTLELVLASVDELQAGADQEILHRARHDDVAGAAGAATRAPMCTASPPIWSPRTSTLAGVHAGADREPEHRERVVDSPGRRGWRDRGRRRWARKPSPAVSISRPTEAGQLPRRRMASCESSRARHSVSPSSAARAVEPTMSVKRTVASLRSGSAAARVPVRNSSISSTIWSACSVNLDVVAAVDLDVRGVRDVVGQVPAELRRGDHALGPLQHERSVPG